MTCLFQDKQSVKKVINNMKLQRPVSNGPLLIGSIDLNPFCISKNLFSYQRLKIKVKNYQLLYATYAWFQANICACFYTVIVKKLILQPWWSQKKTGFSLCGGQCRLAQTIINDQETMPAGKALIISRFGLGAVPIFRNRSCFFNP